MRYITTRGGIKFDVANPTVDMIEIRDIAWALSNLCHWGGHSAQFFSIAQHSVIVSRLCPHPLALWGLLHDAAEAYYGDVSRPLKGLLPEYKAMEKNCMRLVAEKYGLAWPEPPELKRTDNLVLYMEARVLMKGDALHDGEGHPVQFANTPQLPPAQTPEDANLEFLVRFMELT